MNRNIFKTLLSAGIFAASQMDLVNMLKRRYPDMDELVYLAAAFALQAVEQGHTGIDISTLRQIIPSHIELPDHDQWLEKLRTSKYVNDQKNDVSAEDLFVLDEMMFFFKKQWVQELNIAKRLHEMCQQSNHANENISELVDYLPTAKQLDDAQRNAVVRSVSAPLQFITGGPGSGKTTTVVNIILANALQLYELHGREINIMLAAPTGKAADRLGQSIVQQLNRYHVADDARLSKLKRLPIKAQTLHRLLNISNYSQVSRQQYEIDVDLLIVDEASMIDTWLMDRLLQQLPEQARLIFVGDPDQLPSVESGSVFADLIKTYASDNMSASQHAPVISHLQGHYRAKHSLESAALAGMIKHEDADGALNALNSGSLQGVSYSGLHQLSAASFWQQWLGQWSKLRTMYDPADMLAAASEHKILTVTRHGRYGALALNAYIETQLAGAQHSAYYHGRIILITENNYYAGLYNGDTGVCARAEDGRIYAYFYDEESMVRQYAIESLPEHTSAYAMTIHKAQGSEYSNAMVIFYAEHVVALSRELLYTAVTRAKSSLHILSEDELIRKAIQNPTVRITGLRKKLLNLSYE